MATAFYTYEHIRKDSNLPFYVGKGKDSRAYVKQYKTAYWNNIVAKHGYEVKIIAANLNEELALLAEIERIDQLRRLGVKLVNLTDGGEGMSGYKFTKEDALKRAKGRIGLKRPDVSARFKGVKKSPEHRAKLSATRMGMKPSPETRLKLSAASKGRPSSMLGKKHTEESKKKIADAIRGEKNPFFGKTHTPEVMKKIIAANVGKVESAETKAKKSASAKLRTYRHIPTQDQIEKQRAKLMARPRVNCPHCSRAMDEANAKRWHFDNCKLKG
jgi:hypothetical protein